MNRIYRSTWNEKAGNFVAVSELAKTGGKKASAVCGELAGAGCTLKVLATSLLMAFASSAYALPSNGVVAAGDAAISSAGAGMTITQSSQNAALNWQSFNIGQGESVRFVQPNSSAVALNRVLGTDPSSILGNLSANGQVFLVNPNGILFGAGASVNVGGLVGSTLDISDSGFMAGEYNFAGSSGAAVLNQGRINADGGYVALLGARVSNEGVIAARLGTVALAAGEAITLDVAGDGLLNVAIEQGAIDALVDNGGLIQADGGQVLLSAQSAGNLLHTVVNNTGVIQAQTIDKRDGVIRLLGDMQSGTVNVAGTLDASAPTGGDGGFIDTSAATVTVADETKVTTAAAQGLTGSWLIDPADYTIAATGGDISGATLSANLATTDVTILSTSGVGGTAGDVNVNDTVSWSANKLTLNAQNDININTAMYGSGTASLALEYGQAALAAGNTSTVNVNAPVNLPAGQNLSKKLGSDGATVTYTVITELGAAGSTTGTDLQGMSGDLAGHYALGADIDAAATSGWNAGEGFAPVGISGDRFDGDFDGLGHTISHLTINRPSSDRVGLFGDTGFNTSISISNVGLIDASVIGGAMTGGLVGKSSSLISNSYVTGAVTGTTRVGGLVGYTSRLISDSYSTSTVTGESSVGGLMGEGRYGSLSNSYSTGAVTGNSSVGGLIGHGDYGSISNSYATGAVTGDSYVGGLVGSNLDLSISNSYATGAVTGDSQVGGLVGHGNYGSISNSYATGAVTGNTELGGLVGSVAGSSVSVSDSYATGTVVGTGNRVGGLIGYGGGNSTVSDSYATGTVSGESEVGGLVGYSYGTSIRNSYATGAVTGIANDIGGLVGHKRFTYDSNNYATGAVKGNSNVGGLVGFVYAGGISSSYATGKVTGTTKAGGLVGAGSGGVTASYWDKNTSGQATSAGGTGMTTAQMRTQANFTSATTANGSVNPAWDMSNTWVMYEGHTSPLLRSFMTALTVTAADAAKTYDGLAYSGGNGVTYSTTPNMSNVLGTASYSGTSQGAINAGAYGITVNGLYSNQQGYIISYASGALTVNKADLTLSGTRSYDGTSTVAGSVLTANGVGGETFAVTGAGDTSNLASKNVQTGSILANLTGLALGTSGNGGLTSNYNALSTNGSAVSIGKANLTVSTTDVSKTYDGGLTAAGIATVTSGSLFGGDTLSGGTFAFTNKDAGAGNKTVTTGAVTVDDGNAGGNYAVSYADNTTSSILPKALSVSGMLAADKTYDGNTVATLSGGTLAGLVGTETLAFSGHSGSFADASVGAGKAVTVSGVVLSDGTGLAANYSVSNPQGLTADIVPADTPPVTADVTPTVTADPVLANAITNAAATNQTGTSAGGGNMTSSPSTAPLPSPGPGGSASSGFIAGLNLTVAGDGLKLPEAGPWGGTTDESDR